MERYKGPGGTVIDGIYSYAGVTYSIANLSAAHIVIRPKFTVVSGIIFGIGLINALPFLDVFSGAQLNKEIFRLIICLPIIWIGLRFRKNYYGLQLVNSFGSKRIFEFPDPEYAQRVVEAINAELRK